MKKFPQIIINGNVLSTDEVKAVLASLTWLKLDLVEMLTDPEATTKDVVSYNKYLRRLHCIDNKVNTDAMANFYEQPFITRGGKSS